LSRCVQRFPGGGPRRAARSDSTPQLSAQPACRSDSTPQLSAQPATRRPPRTVHRPRRPPQAHPDTALRREWRAGGWDIVVVVNYTTAPDPHLRTFADLATTRGRARATSGYRRATRVVWIPDHNPDDFVARCASLAFARPEVVVTGWTAARFHGHLWADDHDVVEVAIGRRRLRRPGVRAYQYEIRDSEIEEFLGPGHQPIRVASPGWALFDLARTLDRLPAMIALDGSKHFYCDGPSAVRALAERYSQRRGSVAAKRFAAAADIRSESPMETELRLFLVVSGFDTFESHVKVPRLGVRSDFADRERKIAVEYDGRVHLTPQQHARDLDRWRALVADGWIVLPLGIRDL